MDESNLEQLLAACISGDDAAQAQFYNQYVNLVRFSVQRAFGGVHPSTHDVDDHTHEVFVGLFENRCQKLEALKEPKSLSAWMVTLTRNQVISTLRREQTKDRAYVSVAAEQREHYDASQGTIKAEANEDRERIRAKLSALARSDRLVLDLYYLHGLKYTEIADVLSENINTISARIRRAKSKLRVLLEDE